MPNSFNQKGQVVIILLLIMVVGLAIALSVASRSVTEISTATKTEESSRAFSAAEAGIERALTQPTITPVAFSGNQSSATVNRDINLPQAVPTPMALQYSQPLTRADVFQAWLAAPTTLAKFYNQGNFEVYFGTPKDYTVDGQEAEQPAIEVNLIYKKVDGTFTNKRYYYDSYSPDAGGCSRRAGATTFATCEGAGGHSTSGINLQTMANNRPISNFYCKVTVPSANTGTCGSNKDAYPNTADEYPIMARIRLLYSSNPHPLALKPTSMGVLPAQAYLYSATGSSGSTQRKIEVLRVIDFMPPFLDYVLFSSGDLEKN